VKATPPAGNAAKDATEVASLGVIAGCVIQSALIAARTASLSIGPLPVWACALPAYLTRAFGVLVVAAPALLVAALAYTPRRVAPRTAARAERVAQNGRWLFALVPALVLALPDRARFIGDYLLRRGAVLAGTYPGTFPQSLWLDRFVQGELVPWLGGRSEDGNLPGARWLGLAACVATTVIAASAVDRSERSRPGSRWLLMASACLAAGGYLCVFTGYARDVVEVLPLSLLLLVSLHQRVRERRGRSPVPELALSALLALHRTALCLVPAYLVASLGRSRAGTAASRGGAPARAGVLSRAALAALVVTALAMAPTLLRVLITFDLPRHAPWLSAAGGAPPPIADARSLWDLLNVLLMLAPAAPLAWLGVAGAGRPRERSFLLAAGLGWTVPALLLRPQQGPFRDYDVYAGLALAWSYVAVAGLWQVARRGRRAGRALVALSLVSTLQASLGLLLVSNDVAATEARVRHALTLADPRRPGEAANMNYYLGLNAERRGEWPAAARAFRAAAELSPSPVRLIDAGRAAAYAHDWKACEDCFAGLVARDSTSINGWCGLAGAQRSRGDTLGAARAEQRLFALCATPALRDIALSLLDYAPVIDGTGVLKARLRALR